MLSLRSIQRINPLRLPSTHPTHPPCFDLCCFSVFACIRIFMFICLLIFLLRLSFHPSIHPSIHTSIKSLTYTYMPDYQLTTCLYIHLITQSWNMISCRVKSIIFFSCLRLIYFNYWIIVIFSQLVFSFTYFLGVKCKIDITYNGVKQLTLFVRFIYVYFVFNNKLTNGQGNSTNTVIKTSTFLGCYVVSFGVTSQKNWIFSNAVLQTLKCLKTVLLEKLIVASLLLCGALYVHTCLSERNKSSPRFRNCFPYE
jgi:hypothetical protein